MPTLPRLTPSPLSDEEIVARVRQGELALFEHLMRRHNSRVYRAARAILQNDTEAEDVMQDAFVRAYEHLGEFEGRARFSTWLTKIAVHEALARARRSKRLTALEPAMEEASMWTSDEGNPEQQLRSVEMQSALEASLAKLPEEFRIVFVLRTVEGMSGAEVADCLGIAEDTVKTRLHRARGRLQQMLLKELEPRMPQVYSFHLTRCDRVVEAVMKRITSG
jgi:RNA polymerase sigma-70 factor (ECF subfamily)